jgi:hypothetical protein
VSHGLVARRGVCSLTGQCPVALQEARVCQEQGARKNGAVVAGRGRIYLFEA